jgi:hypothetical protein
VFVAALALFACAISTHTPAYQFTRYLAMMPARLQRPEKWESPDGSVQIACRWFARITMASMVEGRSRRAIRNAMRKASMWSASVEGCPVSKRDREEESARRNEVAPVPDHREF